MVAESSRKGCSEDCCLRPCLEWIKTPEAQANATVFLAKFYGRAGLINLINAGSIDQRPGIFRSLLYEACGRIINPIYGSVGLMWSGNWQECHAAVEAVLEGCPLVQVPIDDEAGGGGGGRQPIMPLKGSDIRHLTKDGSSGIHKVRTRNKFKRCGVHGNQQQDLVDSVAAMDFLNEEPTKFSITGWNSVVDQNDDELKRALSHDSSVETVELSLVNKADPGRVPKPVKDELVLDLTLGFCTHQSMVGGGGASDHDA